jgi:PPOX class probable F420-dependent enzyme
VTPAIAALGKARYAALTTYRKDGRAVTTPVWPVEMEGKLYVGTTTDTGKVKRLRRDSRVRMAPCNNSGSRILGDWVEGRAEEVSAHELGRQYLVAARRKYGWLVLNLVMLVYRIRGAYPRRVLLRIDLQPGAASN